MYGYRGDLHSSPPLRSSDLSGTRPSSPAPPNSRREPMPLFPEPKLHPDPIDETYAPSYPTSPRAPRERASAGPDADIPPFADRKSTRLNSSHANISYAVFCL